MSDGVRSRSGGIVMVRAEGRAGPPRVGLVVSRAAGNSVRRNRIRRRLRHAVREVPLEADMDYVIIAHSNVADTPFDRLVDWIATASQEQSDA